MLIAPAYILTHITNTVRAPKIGFQMDFSVPIRVATDTLVWNGLSFQKAGLQVRRFNTGKGGIQSGTIDFINKDFTYTGLIMNEFESGISITGYLWWGDGPFSLGDEIQFFKGEIVRPLALYDTVSFEIATVAPQGREIPTYTPTAPDINFLPYPGQVWWWEGDRYEVLY